MDFKQHLISLGDETAGERYSVKPRTVLSWRLGERRPSVEKALEIEKIEKKKITLYDIYK